jgi:hypothetical protein
MRLVLAYIFGDDLTMELMMHQMEPYPLFDLPLGVREHLRFTFQGLAALTLGRKKQNKELTKARTYHHAKSSETVSHRQYECASRLPLSFGG